MRSDIIRLYKSVHTWTGILTGLALFIAFYAGALTVFEVPLARWLAPPPVFEAIPLERGGALVEQVLAARPEAAREFSLQLEEGQVARLSWQKGRHDPAPWVAGFGPAGDLRLERQQTLALAQFVDTLHRTAGLPEAGEVGEQFMGVVSVLYAVALVSGLIVVLPALAKDFLALRLGRNLKRLWLDAHNLVGVASLPFHLIMAMSAVVFAFHDHFYALQDAAIYGGQLKPMMKASIPAATPKPPGTPLALLPPAELLQRVRELSPQFRPTALHYREAGTPRATVRVYGEDERYLLRGRGILFMDAVSGEVLSSEYFPGRQSAWNSVVSSFFALHFASFGGDTVRWSYFFLGLAGAFLFYSGNLLWIETRRRTERRHGAGIAQGRAPRLMAAGTVGVCLGCVAGLFFALAAAKVLPGRVVDVLAWQQGIYYGVFFLCLGWAFLRGAPRAGVALARLAALGALAMPLASLWQFAISGQVAVPAVDVLALLAAAGLWHLARRAAERAVAGPGDSVWALPREAATAASPVALPAVRAES
jgi:uncharacterized iron-regulated membrane protein